MHLAAGVLATALVVAPQGIAAPVTTTTTTVTPTVTVTATPAPAAPTDPAAALSAGDTSNVSTPALIAFIMGIVTTVLAVAEQFMK